MDVLDVNFNLRGTMVAACGSNGCAKVIHIESAEELLDLSLGNSSTDVLKVGISIGIEIIIVDRV